MLPKILISVFLMALCVTVHAVGLTAVFRWIKRHRAADGGSFWHSVWFLVVLAIWMILLHLIELASWAFVYVWGQAMPDLSSALYFSIVTYTTTGYGDLVLPKGWHLVGGVEALTGILMCGWSTGFFFAVVSRMYAGAREDIRPDPSTAPGNETRKFQ